MGGEILGEAVGELDGGALDIAVECGDDGGDVFAADGFVVVVEVGPNGVAGFGIAQLEFEGEASQHGGAGDFLEIVKLSVEKVVAADAAVLSVDGAVAA